jgi:hypothetical protein
MLKPKLYYTIVSANTGPNMYIPIQTSSVPSSNWQSQYTSLSAQPLLDCRVSQDSSTYHRHHPISLHHIDVNSESETPIPYTLWYHYIYTVQYCFPYNIVVLPQRLYNTQRLYKEFDHMQAICRAVYNALNLSLPLHNGPAIIWLWPKTIPNKILTLNHHRDSHMTFDIQDLITCYLTDHNTASIDLITY